MTYGELFEVLKKMNKISPRRMEEQAAFCDVDGHIHSISHTEFNDGSLPTTSSFHSLFQLVLMEV